MGSVGHNLETSRDFNDVVHFRFEAGADAPFMSPVGRFRCKSRRSNNHKNLAKADLKTCPQLRRLSAPLRRSEIDFGPIDMVHHPVLPNRVFFCQVQIGRLCRDFRYRFCAVLVSAEVRCLFRQFRGPGLRIQKFRSWRTRLSPADAAVLSGAIPGAFTTADLRAYVIAVASNRALRTGETIRPEHREAARC